MKINWGIVSMVSLVMLAGEAKNGFLQAIWSGTWLTILWISLMKGENNE